MARSFTAPSAFVPPALLAALFTSSLWLAVEFAAFARVSLAAGIGHIQLAEDDFLNKSHMMAADPRLLWHWPAIASVMLAALLALATLAVARRVPPTRLAALLALAVGALLAGFALSWRICMPSFASGFALSFGIEPLLRSVTWLAAGVGAVVALTAAVVARHGELCSWRRMFICWLTGCAFVALDVAVAAHTLHAALLDPATWANRSAEARALATSTSERNGQLALLLATLASALLVGGLARRCASRRCDAGTPRAYDVLAGGAAVLTAAAAALLASETSTIPARSPLDSPGLTTSAAAIDSPWPNDIAPLPDRFVEVAVDGAELRFEGVVIGWANGEGAAALQEKLVDHRERVACIAGKRTADFAQANTVALFASADVSARDAAKRARQIRELGHDVHLAFVERVNEDRPLLGPTRTVLAGVSPSLTAHMLAGDGDGDGNGDGAINGAETYREWVARIERSIKTR